MMGKALVELRSRVQAEQRKREEAIHLLSPDPEFQAAANNSMI